MSKCLQLLQLIQVIAIGFGRPTGSDGYYTQIFRRQTSFLDWTVSDFSECSANCGGGLRTRSVRCLNKDGIISPQDCDPENRPVSYEFCSQVDCGNPNGPTDTNLLPPSGTYNFSISDGSSASLQFTNQGSGSYNVLLDTLEVDGTRTKVNQLVTGEGTQTRITVSGASANILIRHNNGEASLVVDEEEILSLSNARVISVSNIESIVYQNNDITTVAGQMLASGVTNLVYYDGLRFYRFSSELLSTLDGPGVLYYDADQQRAVYSTDISLNVNLESVIDSLQIVTEINILPPVSTDIPSTEPEVTGVTEVSEEVTEGPEVTDEPEEVTNEPEEVTDEPEEVTDEPEEVTDEPEEVTDEPEEVTDEPEEVTDEPEEVTEESETEDPEDNECEFEDSTSRSSRSSKSTKGTSKSKSKTHDEDEKSSSRKTPGGGRKSRKRTHRASKSRSEDETGDTSEDGSGSGSEDLLEPGTTKSRSRSHSSLSKSSGTKSKSHSHSSRSKSSAEAEPGTKSKSHSRSKSSEVAESGTKSKGHSRSKRSAGADSEEEKTHRHNHHHHKCHKHNKSTKPSKSRKQSSNEESESSKSTKSPKTPKSESSRHRKSGHTSSASAME